MTWMTSLWHHQGSFFSDLTFQLSCTKRWASLPAGIHEHLILTLARWCHIPTLGKIQKTSSQTSARCPLHRSLKHRKDLISISACDLLYTTYSVIFIPVIIKKNICCHLLRTLLAAPTRSYVLASSYMILTRNWPSMSSWASLLKTKWSHHSWATANATAEVNSHCRQLVQVADGFAFLELLFYCSLNHKGAYVYRNNSIRAAGSVRVILIYVTRT